MAVAERVGGLFKLTVALCALSGAAGCKDENSFAADKMPVPTKARPVGFEDIDTGVRPVIDSEAEPSTEPKSPSIDLKVSAFSDADIDELRTAIPKLEGELILDGLSVLENSSGAALTICLNKPLTQATAQVARAYKKAWRDVVIRNPGPDKKRRRLSANGVRFRMTAVASGGATIGCPAPETHTKVVFTFQERTPAPTAGSKAQMAVPINAAEPMRKVLSPPVRGAGRPVRGIESPPPNPRD